MQIKSNQELFYYNQEIEYSQKIDVSSRVDREEVLHTTSISFTSPLNKLILPRPQSSPTRNP